MPVCHRPEGASGKCVIISHFDKYPLITHKLSDYLIFRQCFETVKQGEHLTERGLLEIISLKSSLNLGLPPLHLPMPVCHRPEGASGKWIT